MALRVRTLITEHAGHADMAVLRSRRAARQHLASATTDIGDSRNSLLASPGLG